MVSKENYEIWMMDYLDGNLSDTDRMLLFHFLEQNPHLKDEMNGLENLVVNPQEEVFASKHTLLKGSAELSDMPYAEYLAIKEVESGLDADEQQWKSSYLKKDKTRAILFAQYSKVTLKANQSLRYPLKTGLKRVVLMPVLKVATFKRIGVAAAIALLLSIGLVPFVQNTVKNDTIVAVNETPVPIDKPKTNTNKETPTVIEAELIAVTENHPTVSINKESLLVTNSKPAFEVIKMEPLVHKKIHPLKTQNVNAYELGLNAMMPIVIANNLADKKDDQLALQSRVSQQSEQLTRNAMLMSGSIKLINLLAGNETKVKKVLNQDGQMVAYQIESDNISIRQRIKNKPVTN